MFTILRNHFLKWQRKKVPVQADGFENGFDYLTQLESDSMRQDVASVYERKIEAETVQAILDKLPEKYKAVLILYYMEDSSYQEISEMLAVPLGTVMSRLSRAKQIMKKALLRSTINQPQIKKVVKLNTKR
jgi:RNA polymerase sigma-70 factor (ECF subfamily)